MRVWVVVVEGEVEEGGGGKQVGRCKKLVGRIRFLNSLWQQKSADSCAENGTGIVPRQ